MTFKITNTLIEVKSLFAQASLSMTLLAMVALTACEEPAWPPGPGEWVDLGADVTKYENSDRINEMDADTTFKYPPNITLSRHTRSLVFPYMNLVEGNGLTMVPDSVVWEDVEAFYTDAFAGTLMERDSTVNGIAEENNVTSRVAAWTHKGQWGNNDTMFVVMFTVAYSRIPGRAYKTLRVFEPRQRTP